MQENQVEMHDSWMYRLGIPTSTYKFFNIQSMATSTLNQRGYHQDDLYVFHIEARNFYI